MKTKQLDYHKFGFPEMRNYYLSLCVVYVCIRSRPTVGNSHLNKKNKPVCAIIIKKTRAPVDYLASNEFTC